MITDPQALTLRLDGALHRRATAHAEATYCSLNSALNGLIRLGLDAAARLFCSWCVDPRNPDPAFHPEGSRDHLIR